MIQRFLHSVLILAFLSTTISAGDKILVRYPALNGDGTELAFSFQGDIWSVPVTGGEAIRLTIHEGYDGYPVWSPDGQSIAFSSNRFGNFDIFTIPQSGGFPNRLTYRSSNDMVTDWAINGSLFFDTNREFVQVEWNGEINTIGEMGGTPVRYLDAVGDESVLSPDGKLLAFVRGPCRLSREDYHGSANRDLWTYNTETKSYNQITSYDGQDFSPRWTDSGTLFFISSKSGGYNVWKLSVDEKGEALGEPVQITKYDGGVRYFDVSNDGSKLVVEKDSDVLFVNTDTGMDSPINIIVAADYRFDPTERKTFSKDISEYAVSPNGKYSAFVIRGELFVSENDKEKSKTVNLSNSPYRDQMAQWLSDTTIVFVSDREGQFDLYMVKSADPKETNLFKSLKHKIVRITTNEAEETWPIISPDKKKVAYEIGIGKLVVSDISADGSLSNEKIMLDGWDAPGNVCWSPDSKWLAYSLEDLNFNEEIYIQGVDGNSKPVNVSYHPRGDMMPVWSADGSKLAFLSERNNSTADIWFVWLNKKDWQKTKQDWDESDDKEEPKKDKKKDGDEKKEPSVEPIVIDFDNIHERLSQVTSLSGDEGAFNISKDGKTFYFAAKSNTDKKDDLYSVKWDGTEIKSLTSGGKNPSQLKFDNEYKNLFMLTDGTLNKFDVGASKLEGLPVAAKMIIDYKKEKEQIFDEAWRYLRDGFYDKNFHGNDWSVLKAKYRDLAINASTNRDFRDMFNYLLGEINSSHMGMYGDDRADTQKETTGLLGVELIPNAKGVEVVRVIPDTPADREDSKLFVGDIIFAVNGSEIKQNDNFYSHFVDASNEKTLLEIKGKDGKVREVVIRPARSINNNLYNEWVKENRKLVDKYSNGKLGYLHIEEMGWESFERFEREIAAVAEGKDGIVIDVRYNGGGWTTDYLMTVLNTKQHAYTIPRGAAEDIGKEHKKFSEYYPYAPRLPYYPWMKPSVALCNESSYSNAEIFSHAYKTLGIGTLVGVPTFGAVISTGGTVLMDGTRVRLPFRAWYVKATGEDMEKVAATPQEIVYNAPDSKSKGKDEQLKKAVEVLLKQLAE
ncbi:MAG: PDZ domain-containing protein [Bacteroidetes bacterium]|nr:PDZ domain-containing protein [Bacteroidota bacterium]